MIVLIVAVVALGWAALAWLTGAGRTHWFGVRISGSNALGPLLLGVLALGFHVWRWPGTLASDLQSIGRTLGRLAGTMAALLSIVVLAIGIRWGSTAASGSDSYGYVSQAWLFRHGRIIETQDIVRNVPWPAAESTFAPLGYRPGPPVDGHPTIVPTYAAGLPALMAIAQAAVGECGAFLIVPICGALTVWLTYVLARQLGASAAIALLAAWLMATSPVFLYMLMWPMSDVPVTAAWMMVLVLIGASRPWWAGALMAIALVIRPNLVLLPVVILSWALLNDCVGHALSPRERRRWTTFLRNSSTVRLALGLVPAIVAIAMLNARLYGSVLTSGYGPAASLYAFRNAALNASRYSRWAIDSQTPIVGLAVFFFVVPGLFVTPRLPHARILIGGTIAAVIVSYLFYTAFDAWWFLRFLLPMWPILLTLTALGIDAVTRRLPQSIRTAAVVACAAAVAWHGLRASVDASVFRLGEGEQRYVDAARYVAGHTDLRAVVISLQHSGSIRYYAGRATVRYDALEPEWLDRTVDFLNASGRRPYILLEDWELDVFRERFAAASRLGRLDWRAAAVLETSTRVALYDPILLGNTGPQVSMPDATREGGWERRWPCPPASASPVAAR